MGNCVCDMNPGTSGSEVYRKPSPPTVPLFARYTDVDLGLADLSAGHTGEDLERVRRELVRQYGGTADKSGRMCEAHFVTEMSKSLPSYLRGSPTRFAELLFRRLRDEVGSSSSAEARDGAAVMMTPASSPSAVTVLQSVSAVTRTTCVESVSVNDFIDLADTVESCQTPDDRLAFAFYILTAGRHHHDVLLRANNHADDGHEHLALDPTTEFRMDHIVELMSAILELKGNHFGNLSGVAAEQFSRHVCEILDTGKRFCLTLAQLVDAYESSPFYEELLCF